MAKDFEQVDIWVGRFGSREGADAYFEEQYENDDDAVSEFAGDQGEAFVDHDFMEREHHAPPETDLGRALLGHSFAASYMAQAAAAFAERPFRPFDTVVLVWGDEVKMPASISRDRIELHYVGRFASDPKASDGREQ